MNYRGQSGRGKGSIVMKVILCEEVDNLGAMGETVKVADGYARNF